MTNRRMRTLSASLFAAMLIATMASLTGAGAAQAAPVGASATRCDGFKIASAAHVTGGGKTYGAVQLLRNYCHADGDDYIVWVGRGFAYDKLPRGDYLNVQLHGKQGQFKKCNLGGGNAPNAHCTTPPLFTDITADTWHLANGTIWACGPTCGRWYAFGETAKK